MCSTIVFQKPSKVEVEPVKCKPAKYGSLKTTLLMSGPSLAEVYNSIRKTSFLIKLH